MQMDYSIPQKTKRRTFSFFTLNKIEISENYKKWRACTQLQFQMTIQSERSFYGTKFNDTPRKKFSQISTKENGLWARDFYEVITTT